MSNEYKIIKKMIKTLKIASSEINRWNSVCIADHDSANEKKSWKVIELIDKTLKEAGDEGTLLA